MLARALREPVSLAERVRLLVELGSVEVVTNPYAADRRLRQAVLDAAPGSGLAVSAADLLQLRGDAATARRVIATACARGEGTTGQGTASLALAAIGWLAENDCAPGLPHPAPAFPHPDPDTARPAVAPSGVAAWALTLRGAHLAKAGALARAALSDTAPGPRPFGPRIQACRALLHADEIADAVLGLDAIIARRAARASPRPGPPRWCSARGASCAGAMSPRGARTWPRRPGSCRSTPGTRAPCRWSPPSRDC
jgi:hypothetical protein